MATVPAKACKRCKKRTTTPGCLCDACQARADKLKAVVKTLIIKKYDSARGSSYDRGYDQAWRKVRSQHMEANPLCARCLSSGITTAAQMVHHIKPVLKYPEYRLDPRNLMSLCNACHEIVENRKISKESRTPRMCRVGL